MSPVEAGPTMGRRQGTAATQTRAHFTRVVSTGSWEVGGRKIYMVLKLQGDTKGESPISSSNQELVMLVTLKLKQELDAQRVMLKSF